MKRPKGVVALVVYYIGSATVLVPLVLLVSRKDDIDVFSRATLLFISPVLVVLSIGLWRMKNWARVFAVVLTGVGLVAGVMSKVLHGFLHDFGIWTLAQDLIVLTLNLWIVIYLMSSRIRRVFLSSSGDM